MGRRLPFVTTLIEIGSNSWVRRRGNEQPLNTAWISAGGNGSRHQKGRSGPRSHSFGSSGNGGSHFHSECVSRSAGDRFTGSLKTVRACRESHHRELWECECFEWSEWLGCR